METMTRHQKKDIKLLGKFVEVYCVGKHREVEHAFFDLPENLGTRTLCPGCAAFLQYAITRRLKCPLEAEKPTCKHCRTHCYATPQLAKVKEIMAYSGRTLMLRGRLDYIWHYFF
ncbi:MAG: nitrous oxide-stimulated promoter family protein [Desulfuromonadaceae bacterium]|nr:nitrous oxide-stimulated promoter family protein [Desulfuromonadaceae bacterium]MDD5105078.1 nitrous oxide-stimulated promoter family protein [Desulfuromonadaceae bacterium]